ncbi:hypothetical protein AB1Y20_008779 [Prymnesium parvum]|uniref:Uncharacterized protein n=1 Tax=Prymnesium parvum TaxID=97485 RepID=A0AB34IU71_PRYPA
MVSLARGERGGCVRSRFRRETARLKASLLASGVRLRLWLRLRLRLRLWLRLRLRLRLLLCDMEMDARGRPRLGGGKRVAAETDDEWRGKQGRGEGEEATAR